MSRGLGKIQRQILLILEADHDEAWTTGAICDRVYRGANRIEKKHRVAVVRAIRNLPLPKGWRWSMIHQPGGEYILYNRLSVESTCKLKWRSGGFVSSFEKFKAGYRMHVEDAEKEVDEYRRFTEADPIGQLDIMIAQEKRRLAACAALGVAGNFMDDIADTIRELTDRRANMIRDLSVSNAQRCHEGNTYLEAAE